MRVVTGRRGGGVIIFPFLFGGTFIEGERTMIKAAVEADFPSFSEGLSLREPPYQHRGTSPQVFPFLFGGTFIEGMFPVGCRVCSGGFPFLFGGTFIEGGNIPTNTTTRAGNFPSFSEGLSLREPGCEPERGRGPPFPFLFGGTFIEGSWADGCGELRCRISLPFRRDFH